MDLARIGRGAARIYLPADSALERKAREIRERLTRGGSVISDEPALSLHRGVQRGDVRIADDGLGRDRQHLVINSSENANHSVTAAQTPERIDCRIAQCGVDVAQ